MRAQARHTAHSAGPYRNGGPNRTPVHLQRLLLTDTRDFSVVFSVDFSESALVVEFFLRIISFRFVVRNPTLLQIYIMKMASKIVFALVFIMAMVVSAFNALPVPDHAKIRIHVPIKHHTHLHTKTVVKTVHVGIPVKNVKPHEEEHGWEYGKKKKGASSYLSYI
uniref:Uncharacterized protein n=2 Tax=gambiae species complex TaxID=44542 RepID=A0A182V2C9_ANOME